MSKNFKLISKLAATLVILASSNICSAAMVTYSFEGTITGLTEATPNGLEVGDAVSYQVALDFTVDGYSVRSDGTVYDQPDRLFCTSRCTGYWINVDNFYAEYLSGSEVPDLISISSSNFYGTSELAVDPDIVHRNGRLNVSSGLSIISDNKTVQEWQIGDTFLLSDTWLIAVESSVRGMPIYEYGTLNASIELVDISAVPLPASLWLFSGALTLLGIYRKNSFSGKS